VNFPVDWDVMFSSNHWCNEITMHHYVQNVIVPYVKDTREKLHLGANQRALCIFEHSALMEFYNFWRVTI